MALPSPLSSDNRCSSAAPDPARCPFPAQPSPPRRWQQNRAHRYQTRGRRPGGGYRPTAALRPLGRRGLGRPRSSARPNAAGAAPASRHSHTRSPRGRPQSSPAHGWRRMDADRRWRRAAARRHTWRRRIRKRKRKCPVEVEIVALRNPEGIEARLAECRHAVRRRSCKGAAMLKDYGACNAGGAGYGPKSPGAPASLLLRTLYLQDATFLASYLFFFEVLQRRTAFGSRAL